jgi:hypothetical protein
MACRAVILAQQYLDMDHGAVEEVVCESSISSR